MKTRKNYSKKPVHIKITLIFAIKNKQQWLEGKFKFLKWFAWGSDVGVNSVKLKQTNLLGPIF